MRFCPWLALSFISVNAVPLGKTLAFHDTIVWAFAMARGFSEAAIAGQNGLRKKSVLLSINADSLLCAEYCEWWQTIVF